MSIALVLSTYQPPAVLIVLYFLAQQTCWDWNGKIFPLFKQSSNLPNRIILNFPQNENIIYTQDLSYYGRFFHFFNISNIYSQTLKSRFLSHSLKFILSSQNLIIERRDVKWRQNLVWKSWRCLTATHSLV